jgi:hypothetical protein
MAGGARERKEMNVPNSPYVTRREAAEHWRKSLETIDRWAVRLKWQREIDPMGGVLFFS